MGVTKRKETKYGNRVEEGIIRMFPEAGDRDYFLFERGESSKEQVIIRKGTRKLFV